jgi:nucleoside 2-deoxyribosyltransferase
MTPFLSFQRRVYIAAPRGLFREARALAAALEAQGFAIASTWHAQEYGVDPKAGLYATLDELEADATARLDEVRSSHALVLLVTPRTWRLDSVFEAFFAHGNNKPVYVLRTGSDAIPPTTLLWAKGFEHPHGQEELLLALGQGKTPT